MFGFHMRILFDSRQHPSTDFAGSRVLRGFSKFTMEMIQMRIQNPSRVELFGAKTALEASDAMNFHHVLVRKYGIDPFVAYSARQTHFTVYKMLVVP